LRYNGDMGQVGRDEAARILKGGFGRELLRAATHYSAPIFWANPPSHSTSLTLNNATMFFLECGGPIPRDYRRPRVRRLSQATGA